MAMLAKQAAGIVNIIAKLYKNLLLMLTEALDIPTSDSVSFPEQQSSKRYRGCLLST
jgi:hypothetical protein